MAQQESWEDLPQEQQAAEKKGMPRWLLFCGCGCLLAVLAVAGAFGGLLYYGKRLQDPEVQLPRLARVLAFDAPLQNLEFVTHVPFGFNAYILQDPVTNGGYVLLFTYIDDPEPATSARQRAFDPENEELVGGTGRRTDIEPVTIAVQGRALNGVRFQVPERAESANIPGPLGRVVEPSGASIQLDLTPPGNTGLLVLTIFRVEVGNEPISEEYVRRTLEPFHVGPDR